MTPTRRHIQEGTLTDKQEAIALSAAGTGFGRAATSADALSLDVEVVGEKVAALPNTSRDIAPPLLPPLVGVVAPLYVCVDEVQGMTKRYCHTRPVTPSVPGVERPRHRPAVAGQAAVMC